MKRGRKKHAALEPIPSQPAAMLERLHAGQFYQWDEFNQVVLWKDSIATACERTPGAAVIELPETEEMGGFVFSLRERADRLLGILLSAIANNNPQPFERYAAILKRCGEVGYTLPTFGKPDTILPSRAMNETDQRRHEILLFAIYRNGGTSQPLQIEAALRHLESRGIIVDRKTVAADLKVLGFVASRKHFNKRRSKRQPAKLTDLKKDVDAGFEIFWRSPHRQITLKPKTGI